MQGDETFNNLIIELASYREARVDGNVISFQDAKDRYRKFERKSFRNGPEGTVIMFAAHRMAALGSQYL